MTRLQRPAARALVLPILALAVVACGADAASPTPPDGSALANASPGMAITDLSVIGCALDDAADVGELTGAWRGIQHGVYYIRQIGDCVWWYGTEVFEHEPGATNQFGYANVASGRMVGTQVDLEWADVPLGDVLNAGGLTFVYDQAADTLTLVEQRGGIMQFGDTTLTRIDPAVNPSVSPRASATP